MKKADKDQMPVQEEKRQVMYWLQTFTGKKIDLINPTREMVDIEDIAHSLSMICRYNGHCRDFYSVAEHSVMVEAMGSQILLRREAELMDHQRRLAADFNNFRNRAQRDITLAVEQAERKIFLELLPVLDNFDRGLAATYQDVDVFRSGVELVRKQFLEALRRLNVEQLPLQVGDPFDALHAEALTTYTDPNLPDGSVAAIYEQGFNLKGQLLRAARVVVNRL